MDDDILLEQFSGIREALGSNTQMTKDVKWSVDDIKSDIKDMRKEHKHDIECLDIRVSTLETDRTVQKEKENGVKEHPYSTITIGGVSLTTIIGIVVFILNYTGVM